MTKVKWPSFENGQGLNAEDLNNMVNATKEVYDSLENTKTDFNKRIDNFYGKLIEIFGIFVAIFSFIIVGAQSTLNCCGGFWDRLSCSAAIFIPITITLVILVILTHKLRR